MLCFLLVLLLSFPYSCEETISNGYLILGDSQKTPPSEDLVSEEHGADRRISDTESKKGKGKGKSSKKSHDKEGDSSPSSKKKRDDH